MRLATCTLSAACALSHIHNHKMIATGWLYSQASIPAFASLGPRVHSSTGPGFAVTLIGKGQPHVPSTGLTLIRIRRQQFACI